MGPYTSRIFLGRHLNLLGYYGEGWLRAHLAFIFPDESDMLRRAAWLGHLMSDYRPAISLMPRLTKSYMDEIDRLEQHEGKQDHEARGNRLGDYLLVHYLADAAPMSVMEAFWQKASVRLRQHVMGFLGREFRDNRLRTRCRRSGEQERVRIGTHVCLLPSRRRVPMSTGLKSGPSVNGLSMIPNIDPNWLLDQLLRMLKAGFAPNHPFSAIEWLGKIAHSQPDKAAEVLSELLNNSRAEYSAYATHQSSIRTILECGLMVGTPDTAQRVRDTISVLATRAETS